MGTLLTARQQHASPPPRFISPRSLLTLFLLLLDITASPPLVTTAKGLLMPSPPSWLEPAGSSLPPLPSSTTLLPFLWPTPTHWPTLATLAFPLLTLLCWQLQWWPPLLSPQ